MKPTASKVKEFKTNLRNKGYGIMGRQAPAASKKEISVWAKIKAKAMKERNKS